MNDLLTYIFWPNPGTVPYSSPKAASILIGCLVLVLLSFFIKRWRRKTENTVTRKLTRSWPSACFWFGLIAAFLVVCRVEGISYLSMRLLWIVWVVIVLLYVVVQIRLFRARHYEVLPREKAEDPREKYLPKKK